MISRLVVFFVATAGIPLWLLCDTGLAYARGWRTTSSLWLAIAAPCLILVALALAGVGTRRGRAFVQRRGAAVVLACVMTAIAWTGAELVAGMTIGNQLLYHRNVPGTVHEFAPRSDIMPGVSGAARHTANAWGMRGPEPPARQDAYRILCIGGSTTACLYLDDTEAWPELLRQKLVAGGRKAWVGDVGQSGYGSWNHLQFLEDGALVRQFDCVVFLVGINDFTRALQRRRIFTPFGVRPIWEHSPIYTLIQNIYHAHRQRRRHLEENPDGSDYIARRERRTKAESCAELPRVDQGLAEYRQNLEAIIDRCRSLGVRCVFLTQPVLWRKDLPVDATELLWFGELPDGRYLSAPALRKGMEQFNALLRDTCTAAKVECVDLAAMHGDVAWFYDDCHFTEAGSDRIATLVAEALLRSPF